MMMEEALSLRQKYREIVSKLMTPGAIGMAVLLGSAAPVAANPEPAGQPPSSAQGETVETIFVPRIVYRYSAGGNSFDADDIGGAWSGNTPATAETYVARFPLNATVAVWFNPRNPTESTLSPGAACAATGKVLAPASSTAITKTAPAIFRYKSMLRSATRFSDEQGRLDQAD